MLSSLKSMLRPRRMIVSGLQVRLIVGNFLVLAALLLILVPALFLPLVLTLDDPTLPVARRGEAARQILALQAQAWIGIPLILALCLAHSLIVTHRVAGPLFRFNRIFGSVARGDLSGTVRIRKADYLGEEARSASEMVVALATRIRGIRDGCDDAAATLPRLKEAAAQGDREDFAAAYGRLEVQLDQLGRRVREFTLPESGTPAEPPLERVPDEQRDSEPLATY